MFNKVGMLEVQYEPYPDPEKMRDLRRALPAGITSYPDQAQIIRLYKERYGAQAIVDASFVRQAARLDRYLEDATNNMVFRMTLDIFGKRLMSIKTPDTWWDAFKERWFPKWALQTWPVVYRRWDIVALLPFFHAPENESVITIIQR